MSEIEKALCEVTGIARGKKEAPQVYRKRLLTKLEKVFDDKKSGDDAWDLLGRTKGAQEWFNDAIKADKAKKDLDGFTDDQPEPISDEAEPEREAKSEIAEPEGEAEQEGDSDVAVNGRGKHGKSKKASAPAKKVAAKAPAKAAAKETKSSGRGGTGSQAMLNNLMVKDPGISAPDLMKALDKKGYKLTLTTVSRFRAHARTAFRALKEAGYLKDIKL